MCNVGYCYEKAYGTDKDDAKAFEWYTKSAEAGNVTAMRNVGISYENGTGVDIDKEKALEWYQKALDAGNKDAQDDIARLKGE